MDAVQGKGLEETVNGILAEFTFEKWDGLGTQSYYSFITEKLAFENPHLSRASEQFKKMRTELLKGFAEYLKAFPELLTQYQSDKAQMIRLLSSQEMVIFPSFFKVINWLNTHYSNRYAIYLRTFGTDLPEVVPAIQAQAELQFAGIGEFKGCDLSLAPIGQTLEFFKNPQLLNYAIRDDYAYWKSKGFQAVGGKLFPVELSDVADIHIFFDDNANDPDKPIICPVSFDGALQDTQDLLNKGIIVAVNPKEAILDEDYFIKKVQTAVLARGK